MCSHQGQVKIASASDKVYKDECTLCFDTPEQGLNVCLTCFNGACSKHSLDHVAKSGHSVALYIKSTVSSITPPLKQAKLTKLAISEPDVSEKEKFEYQSKCLTCNCAAECPAAVHAIVKAHSAKQKSDIKAWENEIHECAHTRDLMQEQNIILASKSLAHCKDCELSENLWLCLICGSLGCGRQQFGGVGGSGHGLHHNESTGHAISVKLGTITPEGSADVFCYSCNDERVDAKLGLHLRNIGIEIADQQKTEKSLTELQIEQNLKFDFNMQTDDGKIFDPLFGPGLTGLKNLGNTCYLASVVQSLFRIPAFKQRYFGAIQSHQQTCSQTAADCFHCQMEKLADGLLSGRYSVNVGTNDNIMQRGIPPQMFKDFVGKGHHEFSAMRQQDAADYFTHLISIIEQKEHTKGSLDPTKAFNMTLENRMQCKDCKAVKYSSSGENTLSLFMPNVDESTDSVNLVDCLDTYFGPSINEDWLCPSDQRKTSLTRSTKFSKFPNVLVCTMKRFVMGENYVTKKLNVIIKAPVEISLTKYRAKGLQSGETLLSESEDSKMPDVNQNTVNQLLQMGFPEIRCKRALIATGNRDADTAMMWLLDHMEDSDIDDPILPVSSASGGTNAEHINSLVDMGFTSEKAKRALKETNNDLERAVTWLFSHMEDDIAAVTEPDTLIAGVDDGADANYSLVAFISHKGTSTACGHYVAHLLSEDSKSWVLFNDEKVVGVPASEIEKSIGGAYMYFYHRH